MQPVWPSLRNPVSVCLKSENGSGRRFRSFHTQFLSVLQPNQYFYSAESPFCQATSLLDAPKSPEPQHIILMSWWHIRATRLHIQYAPFKGNEWSVWPYWWNKHLFLPIHRSVYMSISVSATCKHSASLLRALIAFRLKGEKCAGGSKLQLI